MSKEPLVSVIVPTKNSEQFLEACLKSIADQSYTNVEIIVVDNFSTDSTPEIAKSYTKKFYQKGPERSAQRNFGVKKSSGKYVLIIDSDMQLSSDVVKDCVEKIHDTDIKGIIIPEESFGEGFWAQCKKLERSFYVGVDWIEAARFFPRHIYEAVQGYNEKMISGEDWDLSNRVKKIGEISRINSYIMHNEGKISLRKTLKKKSYYASQISTYIEANSETTSTSNEVKNVIKRYLLYISKPQKLLKNPFIGLGMLFMKSAEYGFGIKGLIIQRKNT